MSRIAPSVETPPAPQPREGTFTLLRNSAYRRLWISGGLDIGVRWLEILAISIYVFDVTGSAMVVATMNFAQMAPMVIFGVLSGAIAGRWGRRRMLLWGTAMVASGLAVLAVLAASGHLQLWHVAMGALLSGIVTASAFPIRRTLIGDTVGAQRASSALALDTVTLNATRLLGPLAGGVLMEWVGLEGAYLLGAMLLCVAALLIRRLPPDEAPAAGASAGILASILEGFAYVRTSGLLKGGLAVTSIMNAFALPFSAMVPVIGKEELGLSPFPVGLLLAGHGLGAVTGAIVISIRAPQNLARYYAVGTILELAAIFAFPLAPTFALAMAIMIASGLAISAFSATQAALFYVHTPPALRSRVMGLLAIFVGASPFGVLYVGLLASWFGAVPALLLLTAQGAIAMAATFVVWPELWRAVLGQTPAPPSAT